MADNLVFLRNALRSPELIASTAWDIAKTLTEFVNSNAATLQNSRFAQELVLRALEQRKHFGECAPIIDSLARMQGLFPYIDSESLNGPELLALEAHRPPDFDDVVFHQAQLEIYLRLVKGENVVLSAPTSFGKSLLIDALIATGRYSNIVVVVPTIALIDETRRRLAGRFRDQFKIVTQVNQEPGERNIFIFTQERTLQYELPAVIDFFVVDEFYKLDPRKDPERAYLLNQAFYKLHRTGAQFYMLGPNIRQLPLELPGKLDCHFISTDYATVVSETTRIHSSNAERLETLVALATSLSEPTLIFCASPASARRVATALVGASLGRDTKGLAEAADWVAEQYHPDWILGRALRHGIGLHHGRIPRSIAQYIVRAFNDGKLGTLVCTSTLIEGVNTKAKNVIVYDNRIARQRLDFFTFNNIRGRSGRMFQHFVGNVYLFNDAPGEELPQIDIPVFTQSELTPSSVLVQLEDHELTDRSRSKLRPILEQKLLGVETIKGNRGIDPLSQIDLAEEIGNSPDFHGSALSWTGIPTYESLQHVSDLIWRYFVRTDRLIAGVSSARQLAFKLNRYRMQPDIHAQIVRELADQSALDVDADRAVEDVLEFVRYWPTFAFPRYLSALDSIQRDVLSRHGLKVGDYKVFAAMMENQFVPAGIAALEEYGLPIQVGKKLRDRLGGAVELDEVLPALQAMRLEELTFLGVFERQLLTETIENL